MRSNSIIGSGQKAHPQMIVHTVLNTIDMRVQAQDDWNGSKMVGKGDDVWE